MLILEPILHETIWGGTKFRHLSETQAHACRLKSVGHCYTVISSETQSNIVVGQGHDLHTWLSNNTRLLPNSNFTTLPFRVSLLDAKLNLSIQVHPRDFFDTRYKIFEKGKTESYYIIEPPESGVFFNGAKSGLFDKLNLNKEFMPSSLILDYVTTIEVRRGDYLTIAPGTVHAITAGSLLYEIEESVDATYRIWDYERLDTTGVPRDLHIEQAIAAADFSLSSIPRRYEEQKSCSFLERTYTTKLVNSGTYQNTSAYIQFATPIKNSINTPIGLCHFGQSLLLLPGERIDVYKTQVIIASFTL